MHARCFVLAAFAAVVALGCSAKHRECRQLIEIIATDDEALKGLDLKTKDPRALATSTRQLGKVEGKLADDLDKTSFKTPELKKVATEYRTFAREIATAANELATILDKLASVSDKLSDAKADSAAQRWLAATNKTVDRCKAHPQPACSGFANSVKGIPDSSEDMDAYAKGLAKMSADLRKLSTHDATLKAALDDLQKRTDEMASVYHDLGDLDRKQKQNDDAMMKAVGKEKPLNDAVNSFCGAKLRE